VYEDLEVDKSPSNIEKVLDDIMVSVNTEREKSKKMLKTLTNAKKMFDSKKFSSIGLTKGNILKSEEYKYMKDLANKFKRESKQLKSELNIMRNTLKENKAANQEEDVERHRISTNEKVGNIQNLKRELGKSNKEKDLIKRRLDHQIDYNNRLEKQKDKYKKRMEVIEEKLRKLDQKYKKIRDSKNNKK